MALTTASWITLTEVAFRISLGYSEREVAREMGVTRKQVAQQLGELREELMEQ
jgi:DNA-binding CsgD family transcriptional regulator